MTTTFLATREVYEGGSPTVRNLFLFIHVMSKAAEVHITFSDVLEQRAKRTNDNMEVNPCAESLVGDNEVGVVDDDNK
jgi:hypothetical protein